MDSSFLTLLESCMELAENTARPRMIYKVFPKEALSSILIGEDITRHLQGMDQVLLMVATLGIGIDQMQSRLAVTAMDRAVVFDAAASAKIESYCDEQEELLRQRFSEEQNLFLSTRFSPGYGDLPLGINTALLSYLDAGRKLGVSFQADGLMQPLKTVSAVMGLSQTRIPTVDQDPCSICSFNETCALRRKGGFCGKFKAANR